MVDIGESEWEDQIRPVMGDGIRVDIEFLHERCVLDTMWGVMANHGLCTLHGVWEFVNGSSVTAGCF